MLSVQGNKLLQDNSVFVPKGMCLVGSEHFAPVGLKDPPCNSWDGQMAFSAWNNADAEITALKQWGVNTVLLVLSQPTLANPLFSKGYVAQTAAFVERALANGFVVIARMDDSKHAPCGCYPNNGYITQQTVDAWANLAPALAAFPNVIPDTFNEPYLNPGSQTLPNGTVVDGWTEWYKGQHQLIPLLRKSFPTPRPIIVQGLHKAMTWKGYPGTIKDKAIVYASHPYSFASLGSTAAWDENYGGLMAHTVPILMGELSVDPDPTLYPVFSRFLAYLKARQVGLIGWVFDSIGSQQMILKAAKDAAGKIKPDWDWGWAPNGSGVILQQNFK
jgi:hypothetical protein